MTENFISSKHCNKSCEITLHSITHSITGESAENEALLFIGKYINKFLGYIDIGFRLNMK